MLRKRREREKNSNRHLEEFELSSFAPVRRLFALVVAVVGAGSVGLILLV